MKGITSMAILAAVVPVAAVPAIAGAAPAQAPAAAAVATEYEGTIVSVDRGSRSFSLRDSERGTIRIRVTRSTRYERIAGFRSLRRGMTQIESTVRRVNGRWVASSVERSGGGGRHGGDD